MPTDNVDKHIAFAVVSWLKEKKADDEGLEVAMQCISESFGINVDKPQDKVMYGMGLQLETVFKEYLAKNTPSSDAINESKLQEFIQILKTKGYFNGVEQGTPAWTEKYETAKKKFNQRQKNNPYEGLSAEELKTQGNTKMTQHQYFEAVGYYTEAINAEPTNPVFYCNRAAAYTHLKDYHKAVADCERSIVLDSNYSKAYSRMGTALYYQDLYEKAVDAYKKAVDMDPDNAVYQADLKAAQDKLESVANKSATPGAGMDFSAFSGLMNNPQFMTMAQQVMSQPQFQNVISNIMQNAGSGNAGGMPDFSQMMGALQQLGQGGAAGEGGANPLGNLDQSTLEDLRNSPEFKDNPKLQQIMEEAKTEGPAVLAKHLNDPEVVSVMSSALGKMFGVPPGDGKKDDDAAPQV